MLINTHYGPAEPRMDLAHRGIARHICSAEEARLIRRLLLRPEPAPSSFASKAQNIRRGGVERFHSSPSRPWSRLLHTNGRVPLEIRILTIAKNIREDLLIAADVREKRMSALNRSLASSMYSSTRSAGGSSPSSTGDHRHSLVVRLLSRRRHVRQS